MNRPLCPQAWAVFDGSGVPPPTTFLDTATTECVTDTEQVNLARPVVAQALSTVTHATDEGMRELVAAIDAGRVL